MNDDDLLHQLEDLAERIGITVRYESIHVEDSPGVGGLCRISGKYVLIVQIRAPVREKIRVVIRALRHFDLTEIYLLPAVRELLEQSNTE